MRSSVKNSEWLPTEARPLSAQIKGIVFDLDQTLVDSQELVLKAFQHALADFGIPITLDDIEQIRAKSSSDLFAHFLKPEDAKAALQKLWKYSEENAHKARIFPGLVEILHSLHALKTPMAVWTARDLRSAVKILEANKISHLFCAVVAACDVVKNKPHPEGLLKISEMHLEIPPHELLMVGDHAHDITGAKSAGALSGAAGWSTNAVSDAQLQEKPDFVFDEVSDFHCWVKLFTQGM